jgi:hypothetical protein
VRVGLKSDEDIVNVGQEIRGGSLVKLGATGRRCGKLQIAKKDPGPLTGKE